MPSLPDFTPGFYKHFKGGTYYAVRLVRSADDLEPYVVYRDTRSRAYWVRSYKDFMSEAPTGGPRFKKLP